MKKSHRIIRYIAFLLVSLSLLLAGSITSYAETRIIDQGTDDNISWTLQSDGLLTVNGSGEMDFKNAPWKKYSDNIYEVVIGKGFTNIESYSFSSCSKLEKVSLPNSITIIEKEAFKDCTHLKTVSIPQSVKTIESYAFYGCSSLEKVDIAYGLQTIGEYVFGCCTSLKTINLPNSINEIDDFTFFKCEQLTKATIPNGVKTIGVELFRYCYNLEEVIIPEGVETIGRWAFFGCPSLKSIKLPNSLKKMGEHTFTGCSSLKTITIPEGIEEIPPYCFSYCQSLKGINFPNSLTEIGSDAFEYCTGLHKVIFPENLSFINSSAFEQCSSLGYIIVSNGVVKIASSAFNECYNLKYVFYKGSEREWNVISGAESFNDNVKILYNFTGIPIKETTIKYKTSSTYTGKAISPKISVYFLDEKLVLNRDYIQSYTNNRNTGTATITVKGKGLYKGIIKKKFKINPKGTNLQTLRRAKKAVTVKWKKQTEKMATSRITGYQIQLATNSKFTKNRRSVTVKGYRKASKKVKKLKSGTKYYVRIRTFKTVDGKKYYSKWSKAKAVKTKQ